MDFRIYERECSMNLWGFWCRRGYRILFPED